MFLFSKHAIALHLFPNLALLLFMSSMYFFKTKYHVPAYAIVLHQVVCAAGAFLIFWLDSFFPPLSTTIKFLMDPGQRPESSYIFSFLLGYWSNAGAIAIAAFTGIWYGSRYSPFPPFLDIIVAIAVLAGGVASAKDKPPANLSDEVSHFYEVQKKPELVFKFAAPDPAAPPFDIVILHTCSLSWEDLTNAGLDHHPLLDQFDIALTRFNSVSSYSPSAVLRILRSNCGQVWNAKLYEKGGPKECFLMENLRAAGYEPEAIFNNGKKTEYEVEESQNDAYAPAPLLMEGLKPEWVLYDGSLLANNFELLQKWWEKRLAGGKARAALYYNTVSLHMGNRDVGDNNWWKDKDRALPQYKKRTEKLFDDYLHFFDLLKASGRDVLVVFVPEHGANLIGNAIQGKDLREIPLPQITHVPVGLKFISRAQPSDKPKRIDKPTSFSAVSYLMQQALATRKSPADNPFANFFAAPETSFLGENADARVVPHEKDVYYESKGSEWLKLSSDYYPREFVFAP